MALGIPGRIGGNGSSSPSTLAQYLASIGKDSWYARYIASSGLAPNSDGSGGAVADGGAVGYWSPVEQVSFAHNFIQATAASRPAYGASRDGTPGVYGNASSWWLALDSTTALNGSYTVLLSRWTPSETGCSFSQNNFQHAVLTSTGLADTTYLANYANGSMTQVRSAISSGGACRSKFGWTVTGTGHNNNAPNLLRRSAAAAYSGGSILEVCFTPALTVAEIQTALDYLA